MAKQASWFKQNDERTASLIEQAIKSTGAKRFAGVPGGVAEQIREFLDTIRPRGMSDAKFVRALRAGDMPPLRIPTTSVVTSFLAEILDGIHDAADTYMMALYLAASTIGPSTTAYTATNEATGTGYTAGGKVLAGRQVVLDGTTQILDWTTDPVWANSSITARGCLIYNSSKANRAVGVFDFGGDIVSTNGNFTVTLPAPTAAAGLIRLSA